jgi:tetratricopeptide (TPR) repeat protein
LGACQFELSIIYHEKALAFREIMPIKDNPNAAAMERRGLGLAYAHAGNYEKALVVFNQILESRAVLEPFQICIVMSNRALAYSCQRTKMREDQAFQNAAIEENKLVIQAYRDTTTEEILNIPGLCHYQEIYSCKLLGGIYRIQKRFDEAIIIYKHALWRIMIRYAMRGLKLGKFEDLEDHCRTTLYEIALCYQDNEEVTKAYACIHQCLKLLEGSKEKRLITLCQETVSKLEPKIEGSSPFTDEILSLAEPDNDTLKRLKRNGIFYHNKQTLIRKKTGELLLTRTGIVPRNW